MNKKSRFHNHSFIGGILIVNKNTFKKKVFYFLKRTNFSQNQIMQSLLDKIKENSSPLLSEENLEKGKYLGHGAFGIVQEIFLKQKFALKQINIKKLLNNLKDEKALYENLSCAFFEFETMKKNINHVVRSHKCHYDEKNMIFSFTMDFMSGGDLGNLIKQGSLSFKEYYQLFQNIVTG